MQQIPPVTITRYCICRVHLNANGGIPSFHSLALDGKELESAFAPASYIRLRWGGSILLLSQANFHRFCWSPPPLTFSGTSSLFYPLSILGVSVCFLPLFSPSPVTFIFQISWTAFLGSYQHLTFPSVLNHYFSRQKENRNVLNYCYIYTYGFPLLSFLVSSQSLY